MGSGRVAGRLTGEHEECEMTFGKADLIAIAKSGWSLNLAAVDRGAVFGGNVVDFDR